MFISFHSITAQEYNRINITKEVIYLIENTKHNRKIYFEDIKVKLEDGTTRRLQPIVVKIR